MTMTIVGFDPATGQFGGAVATKNIGVGSRVLRGKGEVGMIGFSGHEIQRLAGDCPAGTRISGSGGPGGSDQS